jgi:hypothetical protein
MAWYRWPGTRESVMKPEDHVKVIGRDGFYVFVEEVQVSLSLQVISLENTKRVLGIDPFVGRMPKRVP